MPEATPDNVFDLAWTLVQRFEPRDAVATEGDPGGLTRWGITKRWFPHLDINRLTEDDARAIFRAEYWDKCRCDELPPPLAIAVADSALNQGPGRALRLLQQALGVEVDGVIGARTRAAIARADLAELLIAFASFRCVAYSEGNAKFRRGWFVRVLTLQAELAPLLKGGTL